MTTNIEDGIEIAGFDIGELHSVVPDTLVFLQKSGRYSIAGEGRDRGRI